MTAIEWLIVVALAVGVVTAVLAVEDARAGRRQLPPIPQPVRCAPPPLPSSIRADLTRARANRGRHARPEEI